MLDNFLNRVASYGGLATSLSSNKSITQSQNSPKQPHPQPQQRRAESPDTTIDSNSSLLLVTSPSFIPKRSRPKLLDRHKKNALRFQSGFGLRQARSLGRLDTLKENENLGSFIRFRTESQSELVDGRIKDLDRIQDLFPNDFLGLHYPDINQFNNNTSPINAMNTWNKKYLQKRTYFRRFLDEAPCTVSNIHGIHTPRQRHLFLFSDVLLLAKPRLGGNFKLKLRLRVSELWISPCSQESEVGFLLGWPVAGSAKTVLLRFCTQAARDTWWKSLTNAIASQLLYEPKTTNIRVSCNDPTTGIYCRRTVNIGSLMSINQIIQLTFNDIPAIGSKNYSLWVCENGFAPCELLGCERPHSIQMSRLRQSLSTDEGFDLEHCNNTLTPCSIVFELRINKSSSSSTSSTSSLSSSSSTPKKCTTKTATNPETVIYPFFGLPLNRLCSNGVLHPILKSILQGLYLNGLETEGIFRRCASAKVLRELKEKINRNGTSICSELLQTPPLLLAALLKEFLRNMPYPLLTGPTIADWLRVDTNRTVHYLHSLLMKLPHDNYNLLSVIVCLLFHTARRSNYNLMSATNLSVCLGPSLLWDPDNCSKPLKSLTTIVEMLIDNCQTLFGSHVVSLLGTNSYNYNNNNHIQQQHQQKQQQQQQQHHSHNQHQNNSNHHVNEEFEVSQISGISLLGHHHHQHHHNTLLQSCNIDHKSESQDSGLMSSESERESPNSNFSSNSVYGQRGNVAANANDLLSRSMNFSNKSSIDEDEAFCSSDDLVKSSASKYDLMLPSSSSSSTASSSSSSAVAAAAAAAVAAEKSLQFKNSSALSSVPPLAKLTTTAFPGDNSNNARRLLLVADNHVVTYV